MNTIAKLAFVFVLVGLVAGGYFALGTNDDVEAGSLKFTESELQVTGNADEFDAYVAQAEADNASAERVVTNDAPVVDTGINERALLVVEGRVVDKLGQPVANADVGMSFRQSFAAFRGGRGRGFTGLFDRGNRNRLREAFRRRKLDKSVKTKVDGRFSFSGPVYAATNLELEVQHGDYAPVVVTREWKKDDGKLVVDDIVVDVGGTAFGVVVDENANPLEGATVKWRAAFDRGRGGRGARGGDNNQAGPGNQRTPGSRGDQSGRRGRFGRSGRGSRRSLERLVGGIVSDKAGRFELAHLPLGGFQINVTKEKYLPGSSERKEIQSGIRVDCGQIKIELGAELTGLVLDQQSRPIAKAEVSGRVSMIALRARQEQERAQRQAAGQAPANQAGNDNRGRFGGRQGRRGRGGRQDPNQAAAQGNNGRGRGRRGGFGGMDFERMRYETKTETDAEGRFHLFALPHGGVRIQVSHERYIDEARDPVDPNQTPALEFRLFRTLAVAGVVLDSGGVPIENYGITARRIGSVDGSTQGGRRGGFGQRGRNGFGARGNRGTQAPNGARGAAAVGSTNRPTGRRPRPTTGSTDPEAAARAAQREQARQRFEQERATREAQRVAERQRQEAYRKSRLGPSGRPPRRIPEPEAHPGGKFLLEGLQPGEYVFDVGGPGYASVASEPIKLERGSPIPNVTIRLEQGGTFLGRILDKKTGKPIRGANVELYVPPLPSAQPAPTNGSGFRELVQGLRGRGQDRGGRGGRRGRGGRDRGGRSANQDNGTRLARTRSDAEGHFEFSGQRPGSYRLVAQARRRLDLVQDNLMIAVSPAGRTDFRMAEGARVYGMVTGREENTRYQIVFVHQDGERRTTDVRPDGNYEIRELRAGSYNVDIEERDRGGRRGRGGRGNLRGLAAAMLGSQNQGAADVTVNDDSELRYDISTTAADHGKVTGTVFLNGTAAANYEVRLSPKTQPQTGDQNAGRRAMLGRFMGGLFSDTTNSQGEFEIKQVPPGNYTLEVRKGRGSRRGGRRGFGGFGGFGAASMHREDVHVSAGATLDRQLSLTSGRVELTLTNAKTHEPAEGVRVSLVPASEAQSAGGRRGRGRRGSGTRVSVRNGKGTIEEIGIGAYVVNVSGRGFKSAQHPIDVRAGTNTYSIPVEPDPEAETQAGGQNTQRQRRRSGNQSQQNNGRQNNGGQGNGRRGGGRRR